MEFCLVLFVLFCVNIGRNTSNTICLRPEISRNLRNYKQNSAKEMSENIFGQISDKTRYVRTFVRILSEIFENMSEIKSAEIKLSEIFLSEIFRN